MKRDVRLLLLTNRVAERYYSHLRTFHRIPSSRAYFQEYGLIVVRVMFSLIIFGYGEESTDEVFPVFLG